MCIRDRVLTLSPDATVEEAIGMLEEYHISGAPVVDSFGHLLGVLSASDVARREHVSEGRLAAERAEYNLAATQNDDGWVDEEAFSNQEDYNPETLGRESVRNWMTPAVVSAKPDDTLKAVCRLMVERSIHRVLVVEASALRGIVSAFDVVRHVAERA